MSSSVLFLAGAGALAVLGSLLVWLFSRPKRVSTDHNEFRNTLRSLQQGSTRPGSPAVRPHGGHPETSGFRMLRDEAGPVGPADPGDPGERD